MDALHKEENRNFYMGLLAIETVSLSTNGRIDLTTKRPDISEINTTQISESVNIVNESLGRPQRLHEAFFFWRDDKLLHSFTGLSPQTDVLWLRNIFLEARI